MFEKGKIIESGSYHELVAKQGYFYNLERGTSFTWFKFYYIFINYWIYWIRLHIYKYNSFILLF